MANREDLPFRQDSADMMPPDPACDAGDRYGTFFRYLSFFGIGCMAALAVYCFVYLAWK